MNRNEYFLTVCLNPTLQKTVVLGSLREGEVNRSSEHYLDASGKGINVSRVLVSLGERVIHTTHCGGRNRELFIELAEKNRIDVKWIPSQSEIRFCYTLLSKKTHTTTEIVEEALPVDSQTEAGIVYSYESLLDDAHTVIISGTKAPGYSDSLYPEMVRMAKGAHKLVILDIRGKDLVDSLPFEPDFIKPNKSEFIDTFFKIEGLPESISEESIFLKMKELFDNFGTRCIMTNGSEACLYFDSDGAKKALPEKIIPLNVTGSGDAFCAAFAECYHKTGKMESSVSKGIDCATRNALLVRPGVIR